MLTRYSFSQIFSLCILRLYAQILKTIRLPKIIFSLRNTFNKTKYSLYMQRTTKTKNSTTVTRTLNMLYKQQKTKI